MIRIIFIQLLICSSLVGASTNNYQIKFYGVPVAEAEIARSDTTFNGRPGTVITFTAISNKLTNFIFPVDNYYRMVIDNDTYNILDFQKRTYQPNVINTLSTTRTSEAIFYTGTKIEIPSGVFNIFTLLDYISYNDYLNLINNNFILEREGILYDAILVDDSDYLLLDINKRNNEIGAIEFTDIFTWAVFKENGKRMIWIDKYNNYVERCVFKINGMNLEAVRIDR